MQSPAEAPRLLPSSVPAKDDNWGGYVRVESATHQGMWIDSKDGWIKAVPNKADPLTFVDKFGHYEIRQKSATGRPLVLQGSRFRFVSGAEPGRFQVF
ncbi:hypothetical protein AB0N28_01785 [Streptomyces sp. NPDC051130]|uniref:hypothetical protein n=1 Tax=Streptomyces sp. NPDC051130 TaxID=3157223 RepID=UPI003447F75C